MRAFVLAGATLSPAEVGALKQFAININDSNRWVYHCSIPHSQAVPHRGANKPTYVVRPLWWRYSSDGHESVMEFNKSWECRNRLTRNSIDPGPLRPGKRDSGFSGQLSGGWGDETHQPDACRAHLLIFCNIGEWPWPWPCACNLSSRRGILESSGPGPSHHI